MSHPENDLSKPASFAANSSDQNEGNRLMDLPDKCLLAVFKWIPLVNLDDIIELSSRWDKLVQENIPVEVHLTDIGFRIAMHYFIGHDDLPKYRIKIAHSRVLDEKLPELKTPQDLQIVEFATHTSPSTFKSLLSQAVNLRELYFGYGSLSEHLLCELDFNMAGLKLLSISDRNLVTQSAGGGAETSKSILSSNISGFLSKNYPSIEEICITTAAVKTQTSEYVEELLQFIQNHHETLKRVKFDVVTPIQINKKQPVNSVYDDRDNDNDNEYEIGSQLYLLREKLDMSKLSSAKLEQFDLRLGEKYSVGLEQWTRILLEHQAEVASTKVVNKIQ